MAEVFTLKKRQRFQFALEEDPGKVYSLPPLSSLSFEDAQLMSKLGDGFMKMQIIRIDFTE